jgi:hypothetical protein
LCFTTRRCATVSRPDSESAANTSRRLLRPLTCFRTCNVRCESCRERMKCAKFGEDEMASTDSIGRWMMVCREGVEEGRRGDIE